VSDAPHYQFPPARAYRLNRCLYALKSDSDFCARFLRDPAGTAAEMALDAAEQAAVTQLDRHMLVSLGAHPYLVFMAELRLRIAQDPGALEYF
jgi:hypothetical protein